MNRPVRSIVCSLVMSLSFASPFGAGTTASQATQAQVGRVSFATSGAPAAQELFLRGLAQLHNFEYEDAAADFRAAQGIDQGFAMAYWGEAMTKNHPIWMEQDTAAGRAILKRLGPTSQARLARAPTEREKDYLRAVEVLYGEDPAAGTTGSKSGGPAPQAAGYGGNAAALAAELDAKWRRDVAYADSMAALHAKYPDDVDAAAFHALAILGTAHEGRDFTTYMRSAAILEELFPANPAHPGVAHYMIHSYDDPIHAPLGLKAARVYSRIAPDAGHAQHMTSHIFLALGMWDDVISAHKAAMEVVNRRRAAKSQPPRACGHFISWLQYGYLQEGRRDEARRVLDACLEQAARSAPATAPVATTPAVGSTPSTRPVAGTAPSAAPGAGTAPVHVCATAQTIDPDQSPAGSAAQMWGRFLLDSGLTSRELAGIKPPVVEHPAARLTLEFARGLVAARSGEPQQAREALAAVQEARKAVVDLLDREGKQETNDRTRAGILEAELRGAILAAENEPVEALSFLRMAAEQEESLPMAFGPPFVDKPAHELLGEILLEMGRPEEARAAFATSVARAPNRARSVAGLRRCAPPDTASAAPTAAGSARPR